MRANKLANAEYKKLFFRPAIYFMTAFLILALVILTFSFNPKTARTDQSVSLNGTTIEEVYEAFSSASSSDKNSKTKLDASLETQYQNFVNYTTIESAYENIKTMYADLKTLETTLHQNVVDFTNGLQNSKANLISTLNNIKTKINDIRLFWISETKADTIDFFITTKNYNKLNSQISNFSIFFPSESLETITNESLIELSNKIIKDYQVDNEINLINSFKKIQISDDAKNNITEKYYNNIKFSEENSQTLLSKKFTQIKEFAEANATSENKEDIAKLNTLITEYKNLTNIASNLIETSLNQNKVSGLSNKEIKNYKGFENFNTYQTNENFALNTYLLENQIFDGDYLLNLSMSNTSGFEATAFDFTVFAMQILGVILTIFCIFFVCSSIAGDISNGTMKMIAMRPFSRSQIIGGKILACIKFLTLLLVISAVASFVVGYSMFGLGDVFTTLLVFNAETVFELPVYAVLLLYLLSLFINIVFFILIAGLFATLTKNSTFSVFITFLLYLLFVILNATASTSALFAFLPFGSLDLFKFLGNSSSTTLLGMNMIVDGNFFISAIYIAVLSIVMLVSSKLVFSKRDIA